MRQAIKRLVVFFICSIVCSAIIMSVWLPQGYMIMGHDSGYRLVIKEFFQSLFYVWAPSINFGISALFNPAVLPIHIPELFFSLFIQNEELTQKFVLIFWHTLNISAIYFAYILIKPKVTKKFHIIAIISSILYAINFLNLHAWSVLWRTKFSTQFILPLLVFFLYRTMQDCMVNRKKLIAVAMLVALLNGGGSPPLYGPLAVSWIVTGLYCYYISSVRKQALFLFIKTTILLIIIFSVLSAYWLLPYIIYAFSSYTQQLQAQGGIEGIIAIVNAVSENASILNIFRLQGLPSWDKTTSHSFVYPYLYNPFFIAGSFITPIFALMAFFLAKEKKEKQFILLMFLLLVVGMFFTAGSHEPTGFIFKLMVTLIPGFGIFRTAFYKFGMIPWFALSMLSAYTVIKISEKLQRKIVVAVFILFIFLYYAPFFQGDFFNYNKPFTNKINLPVYTKQASSSIHNNTPPDAKILILPRFDWDRMDGYVWGYWGPDPLARMMIHRPIVSDAYSPPQIVDALYKSLYEGRYDDFVILLKATGIHTILWRSDALYSDKRTTGVQLEFIEKELKKLPQIELASSFNAWRIYTVKPEVRSQLFFPSGEYTYSNISLEQYLKADGMSEQTIIQDDAANPDIIQAQCIYCVSQKIEQLKSMADFTPVMLLPGSKMYFFIRWKEQQMLQSVSNQPEKAIDLHFRLLRVRISELQRLIDQKQVQYSLISSVVSKIEDHLMQTHTLLEKINPMEVNEVKAGILEMLKGYRFVVGTLHGDALVEQSMEGLKTLLDNEVARIEEDIWFTKNRNQFAYMVDIHEDGTYWIKLVSPKAPTDIRIDDKPSQSYAFLQRGLHKLEVLIKQANEIELLQFPIHKTVVPGALYELSFDYIAEKADSAEVIVEEHRSWSSDDASIPIKLALSKNSGWQTFQRTIVPDRLTTDIIISLDKLRVKNIHFSPVSIPEVYLFKQYKKEQVTIPKITYTTYNPTAYTVHVTNAKNPFLLNFIQSYDPHWKATTISTDGKIEEYHHVKTNGFSNGWMITKTGEFDILLNYQPQYYVYIGSIIAGIGWICSCMYIGMRLMKKV